MTSSTVLWVACIWFGGSVVGSLLLGRLMSMNTLVDSDESQVASSPGDCRPERRRDPRMAA